MLAASITQACVSFEVANSRASGRFNEAMLASYKRFFAADPLQCLPLLCDNKGPGRAYGASGKESYILPSRATLIVMPSSLLSQWHDEVVKWCPALAVYTLERPTLPLSLWLCPHQGRFIDLDSAGDGQCAECAFQRDVDVQAAQQWRHTPAHGGAAAHAAGARRAWVELQFRCCARPTLC